MYRSRIFLEVLTHCMQLCINANRTICCDIRILYYRTSFEYYLMVIVQILVNHIVQWTDRKLSVIYANVTYNEPIEFEVSVITIEAN